jgi:hypothetical protein
MLPPERPLAEVSRPEYKRFIEAGDLNLTEQLEESILFSAIVGKGVYSLKSFLFG